MEKALKLVLKPTERIKKFNSKPCTKCKIEINTGEKYMSVIYNDTFRTKLFGAFHTKCWNDYILKTDKPK